MPRIVAAQTKKGPDRPRRSFLKIFWAILGAAALVELIILCLSFFRPGGRKAPVTGKENIIPAGNTDQYIPGTVTAFTRGFFYLACLEDGGFIAYSSKCTHLGCTLPWIESEQKFICPCHSSSFDIQGRVLASPAPRPLDRYKIYIENKKIRVDISKKIRRNQVSPRDVVYADQVKTQSARDPKAIHP